VSDPTVFWATVAKVQTLADSGIRVTLDLPETAIVQAAELMTYKRAGVVLDFTATVHENERDDGENSGKPTKPKY